MTIDFNTRPVKNKLIILVFVLVSVIISYFGWKLERYFNWSLSYGDNVEHVIEEKIKPIKNDNLQLQEKVKKLVKRLDSLESQIVKSNSNN